LDAGRGPLCRAFAASGRERLRHEERGRYGLPGRASQGCTRAAPRQRGNGRAAVEPSCARPRPWAGRGPRFRVDRARARGVSADRRGHQHARDLGTALAIDENGRCSPPSHAREAESALDERAHSLRDAVGGGSGGRLAFPWAWSLGLGAWGSGLGQDERNSDLTSVFLTCPDRFAQASRLVASRASIWARFILARAPRLEPEAPG